MGPLPGKNPTEAFHNFHRPLQQDVNCITRDFLVSSPGGRHVVDKTHSLSMANGPIRLNDAGVQLEVGLEYSIIKTGKSGKDAYRCTTKSYAYALLDDDDKQMFAWHWHPFGLSTFAEPHVHPYRIGPGGLPPDGHYPSGRVSLEMVVRCCITQLGAPTRVDDWEKVLSMNEGKFELHRSWSNPQDAPRP